ncbi:MAG TPA: hypothetical protein VKH19_10115 [Gemmatimonadaceae bacterium]|nr:hypothetical protein [Gemmatimonadaceae bacterium]
MASRDVGKKRLTGNDREIPAETKREAQDRAKATPRHGGAQSPNDAMHVDAPKKQHNRRGHLRER